MLSSPRGPSHNLNLGDRLGDRDVFRLGEAELRLHSDEVHLLFALTECAADAQTVWERTQGWPLAVYMIARGVSADTHNLVDDILSSLSPSLRVALTQMSVLEAWGAQDASALGVTLPQDWGRALQESSVPSTFRDGTFQPHDLFRDWLLERLRGEPSYNKLQRAASTLYERRNEKLQAINASLEAGDLERAVTLSWSLIDEWSTRWEWMTLRSHLERFPREALPPNIRAALGASLLQTGAHEEAYSLFTGLLKAGESVGRAYSGLAAYEVQRGDFTAAERWAEKGLKTSPPPFERLLLRQLQAAILAGRDWPAAHAAATEAAKIVEMINVPILETGTVPATIVASQGLERSGADAYREFYSQSRNELLRVIDIAAVQGYPNQMTFALDLLADLDFQQGQSGESIAMINDLMGTRLETNPLTAPHLFQRRGNHYQALGAWDRAISEYERGLELSLKLRNFAIVHQFKFALCECYRYKGDQNRAQELLSEALVGDPHLPNRALEEPDRFYLEGVLAFDAERFGAAEHAFVAYLKHAGEAVSYRHRIVLGHAYNAELARRRWKLTKGHVDALRVAVDRYQAIWALRREERVLQGLYARLTDYGWEPETLRDQKRVSAGDSEVGKLVVETLQTESAELNGRSLDLYPKAFELLVYLLLHNPCPAEDISYALWGDYNDNTGANLRNQLSAIRRRFKIILGSNEGLIYYDFVSKQYQVSERLTIHLDTVQQFGSSEPTEITKQHTNAASPEQFLEKRASPWIVNYRQQLESGRTF